MILFVTYCRIGLCISFLTSRAPACAACSFLRPGSVFGELAVIHQAPRAATIQAVEARGSGWRLSQRLRRRSYGP